MKDIFVGYFTPTDEEFEKLWDNCLFAFDTNVLLGLYRSTAETRQVFFTVLDEIADRIFLPHQSAIEYLRNRIGVISTRSDQYGKIGGEAEKLVATVRGIVAEHAILDGENIAKTAEQHVEAIKDLVNAAATKEPDLLRQDNVLARLAELFKSAVGSPYPTARLKEIYADGAQRYAQKIPPGYKDDKKPEPDKFGDLLIWFQLLDKAKSSNKPIIFVTGDSKEDWLLQHRGNALGPRPELRQEMMDFAGSEFYVYTTPKFLEYATRFLDLELDTKKAESEFEKIEKQDKEATERSFPISFNYIPHQPQTNDLSWPSWYPSFMGDSQPTGFQYKFPEYQSTISTLAEPTTLSVGASKDYYSLLPINGYLYNSPTGKWNCEIVGVPTGFGEDRICYDLKFEPLDRTRQSRTLKLWVSSSKLEHDIDWGYKGAISKMISSWLASNEDAGTAVLL